MEKGQEPQPLRRLDAKGRVSEVPHGSSISHGRSYDHHEAVSYSTFLETLLLLYISLMSVEAVPQSP
jgi:hypothetical protein